MRVTTKTRIRTSQITTQHKVKNEEAIFVILEGVAEIDYEGMVDLTRKVVGSVALSWYDDREGK